MKMKITIYDSITDYSFIEFIKKADYLQNDIYL